MADANDSLSNLVDTEINKTLRPGSAYDAGIDLGTSSRRWRRLYLGKDSGDGIILHDTNSNTLWELDYRGITRSEFEGTATLTPAAPDNPDVVQVTLPRYIGSDFVVLVCGAMGSVTKGDPAVTYDVYPYWHGPIYVCSPVSSGFQAHVTWDVFRRTDNFAFTANGHIRWNNLRQFCEDMETQTGEDWDVDDIPTGTKTLYWVARWPL